MDGMTDDAVNLTPRETDILAARLIAKHIVNDSPAVVLWEDVPELSEQASGCSSRTVPCIPTHPRLKGEPVADQTPDPIDVIANELHIQSGVHGGDNRPFLDRAGQIAQALADASFRFRHFPSPVAGVSAYQWTDEYKPTAPASMSPRQAALGILAELDWQTVIESLSMYEDMDPLAYYGLVARLSDANWLDSRWFMGTKFRSHLTAWATSRMALKSWCLNEDHHDGDMIWFNDCWHGDDEESPCEWGYCWALDGDPEGFLTLAMDLLREGWEPEEVAPVVDDGTHLIQFTEAGWTIAHPISECIDLDSLFACPVRWDGDDPGVRGVFELLDPETISAAYLGRTD